MQAGPARRMHDVRSILDGIERARGRGEACSQGRTSRPGRSHARLRVRPRAGMRIEALPIFALDGAKAYAVACRSVWVVDRIGRSATYMSYPLYVRVLG